MSGAPETYFEEVLRTRILLSLALLPPLVFFVFLVAWFDEGFILIPIAGALYLHMLAQFFVFQNPGRRARRKTRTADAEAIPAPASETRSRPHEAP